MDKWIDTPRQYPRLTLDTLAFAMDILHNPADHEEFVPGPSPEEGMGILVDAVYADIRDMIKNANEGRDGTAGIRTGGVYIGMME